MIPGGVPHAVDEDDELDPDVYEKPMDFNPERWIEHPDLPLAGFGFGRRKCVGKSECSIGVAYLSRTLNNLSISYPTDNNKAHRSVR